MENQDVYNALEAELTIQSVAQQLADQIFPVEIPPTTPVEE